MLRILGIETSCDESSVAVVCENKEVLFHKTISQTKTHLEYGGVVPEVASRNHLKNLDIILDDLIASGFDLKDIDAIAVTACPGLIGGLIVGVMYAKALAATLNKPILAVNHLAGHALTIRLTDDVPYPFLTLLVSGGNSQFLIVRDVDKYVKLGETVDDALGEAFDKVARMLGLKYPGGPEIEKRAKLGNEDKYDFAKPMWNSGNCNLSLAGLKTDITRKMQSLDNIGEKEINDICASFQKTVIEVLKRKLSIAFDLFKSKTQQSCKIFVLSGGVAANKYLCQHLDIFCKTHDIKFLVPPKSLCGDNAVMIAWVGVERYKKGLFDSLDFCPQAKAEL
ncbi:MAG: tRNA (adenosine(37)-N6)-threonylcarbamoyltransferase complex transferase subunit TsaD [Rickettsiales bacterium]|nr:tRNA (adenosine(37)-N6)-threonylcarbamoyltransferase complex transferase subunit TsaD [Rickettsiales bacterium]